MALAILSGMSVDEFSRCVQGGDSASLVRLPGIGKRTAERLIVEMRDRLEIGAGELGGGAAPSFGADAGAPMTEALEALVALGYKPVEAGRMVRTVQGQGLSSEEIIRAALKGVAARG
jgi:Holliday junction DNA helicase RuvA